MKLADPDNIAGAPVRLLLDEHIVDLFSAGKLHWRWGGPMPRADLGRAGNAVMNVIASGQLGSTWKAAAPAISVGRRALEVSIRKALTAAEDSRQGEWKDDWESVSKNAAEARAATRALILDLSGGRFPLAGSKSLERPLHQMDNANPPSGHFDILAANASSREKADALALALAVMSEIEHFSRGRRDEIAATRTKTGEPEKNAFVLGMSEAWIYLAGSPPGKGTERNPFMEFASRAWQDAGGDHDDPLMNAVRKARAACPPVSEDPLPPDWL